jgi:hypothetical protein
MSPNCSTFTEAGLVEHAVDYWRRAGQQALARSAMAEAVTQLTKGLEMLERLPAARERQRSELGLQLALGKASIAAKGFAAVETGRAYAPRSPAVPRAGGAAGALSGSVRAIRIPLPARRAGCSTRGRAGAVALGRGTQ